jgi:hypothetical protein
VQTALELPSSVRSSRLTPAELSRLGHPTPGDQVYIYTAGAYTTCYASAFNGFSVPATHCLPAYQEPPPD